jgi:4-hydroxysphinganine ceramide fatty acyl 2-hydroxylase
LIIIDGRVYDVTDFLDTHPGGDILLDYHGQDVTQIMQDPVLHQHSSVSYEMLDEFYVGEVSTEHSSSSVAEEGQSANHGSSTFESSGVEHQAEYQRAESFLRMRAAQQHQRPSTKTPLPQQTKMAAADPSPSFIDTNRPLFQQLWLMQISAQEYINQVHRPRHLNHTARFFHSPFLEFFSRTQWFAIPLLWLPIGCGLLWHASSGMAYGPLLGAFVSGLFIWSLLEYWLHRFLFHLDDWLPNYKLCIMLHFLLHGVHHFLPMDKYRLVFPPAMGVCFAGAFGYLYGAVFGAYLWAAVLSGTIVGYVYYDLIHYFLHHGRVGRGGGGGIGGKYLKSLKTYHLDHHYKNYREAYGISSKFWDYVFGTMPKLGV